MRFDFETLCMDIEDTWRKKLRRLQYYMILQCGKRSAALYVHVVHGTFVDELSFFFIGKPFLKKLKTTSNGEIM